jgi:limonene-1,2-epoxide hydrolase
MTGDAVDVIRAFAVEFGRGEIRRLAAYLAEDVRVQFPDVPLLEGRAAVLAFLRRLFQTYPVRELRLHKCVSDSEIVLVEAVYVFALRRTPAFTRRGITLFEVRSTGLAAWTDYSDLDDTPPDEKERWRRLGSARW